jgi:hypothetical protein
VRHELHTEIDIDAPAGQVWPHLVDLAAYADWNPFITRAEGVAQEGAKLALRMEPPGGRAATLHPRVTVVSEASALEWVGHLGVPGLFDVRHRFELTDTGPAHTSCRRSRSGACWSGRFAGPSTGAPARGSRP